MMSRRRRAFDCIDINDDHVVCALGCRESRGKQAEGRPEQNHVGHGARGRKHAGQCE